MTLLRNLTFVAVGTALGFALFLGTIRAEAVAPGTDAGMMQLSPGLMAGSSGRAASPDHMGRGHMGPRGPRVNMPGMGGWRVIADDDASASEFDFGFCPLHDAGWMHHGGHGGDHMGVDECEEWMEEAGFEHGGIEDCLDDMSAHQADGHHRRFSQAP